MDRLWAPWRMSWVKTEEEKIEDFISHYDKQKDDRKNLVVLRTELSIVLLNRYPYSNGHLLVAPRRQVANLDDMTDDELLDCQKVIKKLVTAMRSYLKFDGCNVGLNLGRAAGAGLPVHLHWHIVPRWNGDTNFMTLMSDARVIVQSLDESWLQLRQALGMDSD